jgi:rod shape-determining protein MreC
MRDVGGRDAPAGDLALVTGCLVIALLAYALPRPWAASIVSGVRQSALRPVVRLQARAEQDRTSRFLVDEIQAARDSLAIEVLADSALRQENAALRTMLGLRTRATTPWIPAQVMHRPIPTDARILMLDIGTARGVARHAAVITAEGLLGYVWSVSSVTASVLTWMHPEWRASAVTGNGEVMGILVPTVLPRSGQPVLELRGVALRDSLPLGSVVYTSGLGGVFPRMIPIGRITEAVDDPMGYERLYRVAPFVAPGSVSHVMVLSSRPDSVDLFLEAQDSVP